MILSKLASALSRNDEVPNVELAKEIAAKSDKTSIKELVENLQNSDKAIQSDCIKVLYEVAVVRPELVAPFSIEISILLEDKNNRLVWGAMTALDAITSENPDETYNNLTKLKSIAEKGSVITRDHFISILIQLAGKEKYANEAFKLLIEQLETCPTNQLPMYAENAVRIINEQNKSEFIRILTLRLSEIPKESKRKRVEKVVNKLQKT